MWPHNTPMQAQREGEDIDPNHSQLMSYKAWVVSIKPRRFAPGENPASNVQKGGCA